MTLTPIPRCHGLVMERVASTGRYQCLICGDLIEEVNGKLLTVNDDTPRFDLIGPKRSRFLNPLVQLDAQIQEQENAP